MSGINREWAIGRVKQNAQQPEKWAVDIITGCVSVKIWVRVFNGRIVDKGKHRSVFFYNDQWNEIQTAVEKVVLEALTVTED